MFRPRTWLRANPLPFLLVALVALSGAARAATFNPADAAALITAITTANGNDEADTINLTASTNYSFVTGNGGGDTALPFVDNDLTGQDLTINGNGATLSRSTTGGTPSFRLFVVNTGAMVSVNNVTFSNGVNSAGGAIYNLTGTLTLTDCTLSGNRNSVAQSFGAPGAAVRGGGIINDNGTMTVANCTFDANHSTGGVGALVAGGGPNNFGGGQGAGGGIYSGGISASLVVTNSTFRANTANGGTGGQNNGAGAGANGGAGVGGGIYSTGGTLTVTNSTLTGNTANGGAGGSGGNANSVSGTGDGGGINAASGTVTVNNSIVVANTATTSNANEAGTITNNFSITSGTAAEAGLDPNGLQSNGGPTKTIALTAGTAVDAGSNALLPLDTTDMDGDSNVTEVIPFDQRGTGNPRVQGGTVDIGAFESASDEAQTGPTYVVNTAADHDDGTCSTADCTLREAVKAANADGVTSTITLTASTTYTLTSGDPTNTDTGLAFVVNDATGQDLTINGNGSTIARSSAGGTAAFRLLVVNTGATVTVNNVTFSNGLNTAGGAIYNLTGTLTLNNCTISGNTGHGTDIGGNPGTGGQGIGGGIVNSGGTLNLQNCTLSGNSSSGGIGGFGNATGVSNNGGDGKGGAIYSTNGILNLQNCTLSGNTATGGAGGGEPANHTHNGGNGLGGALFNDTGSTLTVTSSTLSANSAIGGPNDVGGGNSLAGTGIGGGINAAGGTVTVNNSIVVANTATTNPNEAGTITNNFSLTSGTAAEAGLDPNGLQSNGGPTKTIALTTLGTAVNTGSNALAAGIDFDQRGTGFPRIIGGTVDIGAYEAPDTAQTGPDFEVNVTADTNDGACTVGDCTLREAINAANLNADASVITFKASVFNTTQIISVSTGLPNVTTAISITGPGANLLTVKENGVAHGLTLFNVVGGVNVTISGLTVSDGSFGINNNGGVLNVNSCALTGHASYGLFNDTGTLSVANSTLSGNAFLGFQNNATATLTNSTITGNQNGFENYGTATVNNCTISGNTASGIFGDAGGTTTLKNTLVVGNPTNTDGTITQGADSITNLTAAESGLGALANNGGPTQTMALASTSPAINAGKNSLIPVGVTTDQRGSGFARTRGGKVDIGAFEASAPSVAFTSPTAGSKLTAMPTATGTSAGDGATVASVELVSLRRRGDMGLVLGFWTGTGTNFSATNTLTPMAATDTGTNFSTWSVALPNLRGDFVIEVRATDANGVSSTQSLSFIVNDPAGTSVTITAPVNNSTTTVASSPAVTGTAGDLDGIAGVTVRIQRAATGGNTAGFWNGTTFDATYDAATHELTATDTGTGFSTWSRDISELGDGTYTARAIATDTAGNYKSASSKFTLVATVPTVSIGSPPNGSNPSTAPTSASGTAAGITTLTVASLQRGTNGGNTGGYWTGSGNSFTTTNTIGSTVSATTTDGFATWNSTLPVLIPGNYVLKLLGTNVFGSRVTATSSFTVNDRSPKVKITSPANNSSASAGSLTTATGTASDTPGAGSGIVSVTVSLQRTSATPGYWNGTVFTATYNPAVHEFAATNTGTNFSTWNWVLPFMPPGTYKLRAIAKDAQGNYSTATNGATATLLSRGATANADGSVSFTIKATKPLTPFEDEPSQ